MRQVPAVDMETPVLELLPLVYERVNYSAPRLPPYLTQDTTLQESDVQGLRWVICASLACAVCGVL